MLLDADEIVSENFDCENARRTATSASELYAEPMPRPDAYSLASKSNPPSISIDISTNGSSLMKSDFDDAFYEKTPYNWFDQMVDKYNRSAEPPIPAEYYECGASWYGSSLSDADITAQSSAHDGRSEATCHFSSDVSCACSGYATSAPLEPMPLEIWDSLDLQVKKFQPFFYMRLMCTRIRFVGLCHNLIKNATRTILLFRLRAI